MRCENRERLTITQCKDFCDSEMCLHTLWTTTIFTMLKKKKQSWLYSTSIHQTLILKQQCVYIYLLNRKFKISQKCQNLHSASQNLLIKIVTFPSWVGSQTGSNTKPSSTKPNKTFNIWSFLFFQLFNNLRGLKLSLSSSQ